MDLDRMPPDWPGRESMRRIDCPPHQWCVRDEGRGPTALLLHGAGGSSHSWRHLVPLLAPHFRVVAPDLPGQGFTRAGQRRFSLEAMAEDLARLCAAEDWRPSVLIGHSAGAALALRLAEILPVRPRAVVGINAALGNFEGTAGWLFPLIAKLLALNPFIPPMAARLFGAEDRVRRLIGSTGSDLDEAGLRQYMTLIGDHVHVDGTLSMMAQWRLDALQRRLPAIDVPTLLIAAAKDGTVPPRISQEAAGRMPFGSYVEMPGLGHLAHEEDAAGVAAILLPFVERHLRT
ncbi:alpha/beta fold hydrolase [Rhodobacter sphaeroides]|jgi:putative magnesium chelatase accessory protein|uniref:Magnesium-chelatase, BchO n=3 Tax=Cereibacter sphaeroides TaxID=1063 RepID=Q3J186_CERS4|nr:alpha/beta fold hydrolase BchO [Cereibacter sphaeroides]AAF24285.1 BchO [Cereibacter sphaeroides]ABA79448.1 Magnesium-chelatase, BchO [Cereibacter sphaeroides 2.4.1]AMJ47741.1 magnesium chelatase [Cereibacter sphaeroides]ANS34450.1 magnesium chelatase [Cereibacter sphaeroides]ATN63498.1 magnesium chelatase [Cereibacter sphaeroides]